MKRVLIIGATSAIASEAAKLFAAEGAHLCLVARNAGKLQAVADDLAVRGATVSVVLQDLNELHRHAELIATAREHLGTIDAVLIAHGVLPDQTACERDAAEALAAFTTNCVGVISLLTLLGEYFEQQRGGCIAVITSVAGDRGRRSNYVYGAAKGAVAIFLQGLRSRLSPAGVRVVTIKPGFVDTPMTAAVPKNVLFASAGAAGRGVYRSMQGRGDVVYVPWFWRWIMAAVKSVPERVFKRLRV